MSFTLVAKFEIPLHAPLLLKRADNDALLYEVQVEGYFVCQLLDNPDDKQTCHLDKTWNRSHLKYH